MYGVQLGAATILIGKNLAAAICFFLGKTLLSGWVQNLVKENKAFKCAPSLNLLYNRHLISFLAELWQRKLLSQVMILISHFISLSLESVEAQKAKRVFSFKNEDYPHTKFGIHSEAYCPRAFLGLVQELLPGFERLGLAAGACGQAVSDSFLHVQLRIFGDKCLFSRLHAVNSSC